MLNNSTFFKITLLSFLALFFSFPIIAQNTFPANGNVGIGTSNPSSKLDIIGGESDGTTGAFKISAGSRYMVFDANEIDTKYGLFINNNSTGNVCLTNGGGNVGIGTTDPTSKLHIIGGESNGTTTATLKLSSGSDHMFLDGNEIDADQALYLNKNSSGNVDLVKGGGNVGIGIFSSDSKLHIFGDESDGTTGTLRISSGTQNMVFDGNEIDTEYGLFLNNNSSGNVCLAEGGGNVGIGTNSPSSKLDVNGDITWGNQRGLLTRDQGASLELGGSGTPYIDFADDSDPNNDYDLRLRQVGDDDLFLEGGALNWGTKGKLSIDQGGSLELGGNPNEMPFIDFSRNDADYNFRLQLVSDHEMRFSANTGTAKVSVMGQFSAQEIKVTANGLWPDYVFEEDYNLNTLKEVEMHIEENGHLPNVPNEATIADEGIDLGALTIIQQEKIEELFLHLIELNKKVEMLVEENAGLKKELK